MANDPSVRPRLHPLLGAAAVAVILTCAVGVYAMLVRPGVPGVPPVVATTALPAPALAPVMASAPTPVVPVPVAAAAVFSASDTITASAPTEVSTPAVAASVPVVRPKPRPHVVHRRPPPVPVYTAPTPYAQPQPSYCPSCGTVVALQAFPVAGPTTGLGGLGGAAVGGLVGNQFGRGGGRTAMTVLGALGGAFAGNAVEQGANQRMIYRMVVEFDDGRQRTFTQDQPFPFGQGEGVEVVNGMLYRR